MCYYNFYYYDGKNVTYKYNIDNILSLLQHFKNRVIDFRMSNDLDVDVTIERLKRSKLTFYILEFFYKCVGIELTLNGYISFPTSNIYTSSVMDFSSNKVIEEEIKEELIYRSRKYDVRGIYHIGVAYEMYKYNYKKQTEKMINLIEKENIIDALDIYVKLAFIENYKALYIDNMLDVM